MPPAYIRDFITSDRHGFFDTTAEANDSGASFNEIAARIERTLLPAKR